MGNVFHKDFVLDDNHAINAREYADITARDSDVVFQITTNLDKIVKVLSPLSYWVLASVGPAVWVEQSSTSANEWTELLDTPASITANLVVQGNAAGTALEFGQDLRTAGNPTFVSSILTGSASNVSLSLDATNGALRHNRLTTTQRDALTPLTGMQIFNTTTAQSEIYNGVSWAGATAFDQWTELTDTPGSISASLSVQGNVGGTALEFGQNLTTTGSPTFDNLTSTGLLTGSTALFQNAVDSTTAFQVLDLAGGTPVFDVDTLNGRVGIGTAAPTELLHVAGKSLFTDLLKATSFVQFRPIVDSLTLFQVIPAANTTAVMSVDTVNSRFGVLTESPQKNFHVRGDSRFQSQVDSTTALQVHNLANVVVFNVDTLNKRVGIGTAAPTEPLHVIGSAIISSDLALGGALMDTNNDAGTAGQILSSTVSGTDWIDNAIGNVLSTGTPTNNRVAVWTDATTIEGDADLTFDGTKLAIGTGAAITDLTIFQNSTGTTQGITFSGEGKAAGASATEGVTAFLGVNVLGNGQLWMAQTSNLGTASAAAFRYTVGLDVPNVGAVNIGGTINYNLNFGNTISNVGVGFNAVSVNQADIISKLHVRSGSAAVTGIITQGEAGQTGDLFQARAISQAILFSLDNVGDLQNVSLGRLPTAASVNSGKQVIIGVTDTTVGRTITIQTADITARRTFIIKDESGAASNANPIIIATQGAQTIDGLASVEIQIPYGVVRLYSNASNLFSW